MSSHADATTSPRLEVRSEVARQDARVYSGVRAVAGHLEGEEQLPT